MNIQIINPQYNSPVLSQFTIEAMAIDMRISPFFRYGGSDSIVARLYVYHWGNPSWPLSALGDGAMGNSMGSHGGLPGLENELTVCEGPGQIHQMLLGIDGKSH